MTEPNAPFAPDWTSPLGDTIADLMVESGWTQAEFAERLGYSAKRLNRPLQRESSADRGRCVVARARAEGKCRFLAHSGGSLP